MKIRLVVLGVMLLQLGAIPSFCCAAASTPTSFDVPAAWCVTDWDVSTNRTIYFWDGDHRVLRVVDPSGNVIKTLQVACPLELPRIETGSGGRFLVCGSHGLNLYIYDSNGLLEKAVRWGETTNSFNLFRTVWVGKHLVDLETGKALDLTTGEKKKLAGFPAGFGHEGISNTPVGTYISSADLPVSLFMETDPKYEWSKPEREYMRTDGHKNTYVILARYVDNPDSSMPMDSEIPIYKVVKFKDKGTSLAETEEWTSSVWAHITGWRLDPKNGCVYVLSDKGTGLSLAVYDWRRDGSHD